jgi:hypothetical protein
MIYPLVDGEPMLHKNSLERGHIAALITRELHPQVDRLLVALHVKQRLGLIVAEAAAVAQPLVLALPVLPHVGRRLGREVTLAAPIPHVFVQRLPVLNQHRAVRGLEGALVARVLHPLVDRLQVALEVVAPRGGVLTLVAEEFGLLVAVPVLPEAAGAPGGEFTLFALEQLCSCRGPSGSAALGVRSGFMAGCLVLPQVSPLVGFERAAAALVLSSLYSARFQSRLPAKYN